MEKKRIWKFRVFGIWVAVSRGKFNALPHTHGNRSGKSRSKKRDALKRARLEQAGWRCEICGIEVDERCALHHRLPAGAEGRKELGNVLVLCSHCHHQLESQPHLLGLERLEDITRWEGPADA